MSSNFQVGDRVILRQHQETLGGSVHTIHTEATILQLFTSPGYTESALVCTDSYKLKAVPWYNLHAPEHDGYLG